MLNHIVEFSVRQKFVALAMVLLMSVAGIMALMVEDPSMVDAAIAKLKAEIEADKHNTVGVSEIFKPYLRTALMIAIGIMAVGFFTLARGGPVM